MNDLSNSNEVIFYHTFFYFPFKIINAEIKTSMPLINDLGRWEETPFHLWAAGEGENEWKKKSIHNQELLYFHHYLREIAFNLPHKKEQEFLKYYLLKNGSNEIQFNEDNAIMIDNQENGFYLADAALYIFTGSDIGILSIGVKNKRGCTLKDAMEFNMNFRLLHITDTEQMTDGRGRIFKHLKIKGTPLANEFTYEDHFIIEKKYYLPKKINAIVDNFMPFEYRNQYKPLLDHRMVLHTMFCLNESLKENYKCNSWEKYRLLFSRILFVDTYAYTYFGDEKFMNDLIKKRFYDRWQSEGTLYGFCRYADATVKFGRKSEFIEDNFKSVYYLMSIIALYYRCALIDFAARSSEVTTELVKSGKWTKNKSAQKLREDFLKFSNVWYFRELTNQDQGIEMFDMHRRAYELDELYHQVKEEIEKLDEHIRMEQAKRLNILIICLTIVAAIVGFFGMNFEYGWFKQLIGKP